MGYQKEWRASPNFTPGSQTQAFYGRPRTIQFGAGHWWDDPSRGPSHSGVVNTFLNPARQASAHAVVSAGLVTEMVRDGDTAWCTNNANPYTFAIECDPRITTGGQAAENVMATLAEYIADKGYHNLQWLPHKNWFPTGCNPIDWNEVMRRAKIVWQQKYGTPPPPQIPEWKQKRQAIPELNLVVHHDGVPLRNLDNLWGPVIKEFTKGTPMQITGKSRIGDFDIYLTKSAMDQDRAAGFIATDLVPPVPPTPEWQQNLKDIQPVKLMVLQPVAPIYNLNDTGKTVGTPIPQGTWIDFKKMTTVSGKEYLISNYAADNAMPNGVLKTDVGVPAPDPVDPEPPREEPEPEWLKNWEDIEDVKMYARVDADLVNLIDGSTVKVIPKGTEIDIASSTEWHGQKFLITKSSTDLKAARGLRLVDLDIKPVSTEPPAPLPEDPDMPVDDMIKEIHSIVKWLKDAFQKLLAKLGL